MRVRTLITFGIILAALILAVAATPSILSHLQRAGTEIPTARVSRGPLEMNVYTMGELRPLRTAMLVAPPGGGSMLQIIHLVPTGTRVKSGDVVVEFDPTEQEYNLEQSRSQLEEADQQIKKMKADIAVRTAQDKVSLLKAQFDVRRAELRVKENELLGAIEARKNVMNLEEAKRRLEQLERDIKSRASSDQADLAVQNVKRSRAMMTMQLAQRNIDNMILRSPIDGIVVLGQNISALATGGVIMITSISDIPEYKEGDQTSAGATIGQIQDSENMEVASKVDETDRGNLDAGQPAAVRVDALPWRDFTGSVKNLSAMASTSTSTLDLMGSVRKFDATFEVDCRGMKMLPGVSARIVIRGMNVEDALSLPRQAMFTKEGKTVVYVKQTDDWEERPVQVKYLTESRAVIDGLEEGTEVALLDPRLEKEERGRKSSPLSSIFGGGGQ
jgi:HlyD family secretion protein